MKIMMSRKKSGARNQAPERLESNKIVMIVVNIARKATKNTAKSYSSKQIKSRFFSNLIFIYTWINLL